MGVFIAQRFSTTLLYVLPAEREEAARAVTLNHGWFFKERCKTLADHACAANDTDIILFHFFHPSCLQDILSKMMKCTLRNEIKVKFHF